MRFRTFLLTAAGAAALTSLGVAAPAFAEDVVQRQSQGDPHDHAPRAADAYEVDDYHRVSVKLASGLEAWVYIAA